MQLIIFLKHENFIKFIIQNKENERMIWDQPLSLVLIIYNNKSMFLLKEEKQAHPSTFDQTHLDIKITHGRSQLQEVKVVGSWISPAFKSRLPKLTCQWFNKTDTSMQLIPGVTEDSYQPSIIDVGTSIYIQIVPESKDLEYEGMPITRSTNTIQLASETQEQAKELLEAGKSTFFVELKQLYLKGLSDDEQQTVDGKVPIKECLLKIAGNKIMLIGRTNAMEKADVLLSVQIGSEYPQLQIDRTCGRFLNVLFNADEYSIVILQNNKIRDILYLLIKMIQQKEAKPKVEQKLNQTNNSSSVLTKEPPPLHIRDKIEEVIRSDKLIQSKNLEESLPLSPQTIQKQSNQPAAIIVISELRNKLVKVEFDYNRSVKELSSIKEKISSTNELNINLTKQLEAAQQKYSKISQQLREVKQKREKQNEQMCYLKNQCRILEQKNNDLHNQLSNVQKKMNTLVQSSKLSEEQKIKYGIYSTLKLQDALNLIINQAHELQEYRLKNDYLESQIQKYQQEIAISKTSLEELQGNNKHLLKKVQSLLQTQAKWKNQTSTFNQEQLQAFNFTISKQKEEQVILKNEIQSLQKDKVSLRMQVKELIEENTVLRSKQKSSKHELKLEIVQLKKLVNRFTEMITDKDLQIQNLKIANKTLNQALIDIKK